MREKDYPGCLFRIREIVASNYKNAVSRLLGSKIYDGVGTNIIFMNMNMLRVWFSSVLIVRN